jgi:serine/threonine protein kinase
MELIINDYRILDKLGEGAYGSAFLAEHTKTNKKYAIKIPREPDEQEFIFKEAINKETDMEIQVLSKVKHPFIISMVDWFPLPDDRHERKCIVMEFAEGNNL